MRLDPAFLSVPLAHRGLHDDALPENSLGAMRAAIAAGYGIETDVQLSADGRAIVFHDDTLARMTGAEGFVVDRSAEDLGQLPLGRSFEGIPTLRQFLALVAGRAPVLIELKDQTARPGGTLGPLEAAVARDLDGYAGPVAVMSFHPGMVENMARCAPGIARGITGMKYDADDMGDEATAALNDYTGYSAADCCFVSHHWRDLGMDSVARLKAAGAAILCWTIRSAEEEAWARKVADNITFENYLPA